jgi:hypothetical protein
MSQVLGVLFAILVGMLVLPNFGRYQQMSNDNSRATATAQQQQQLYAAAASYIEQNATAVQAACNATTPAVITVGMLQGVNLLSPAFNGVNPFGQTWEVQVLQPSAGILQALVMATGGTAIPDVQASKIATLMGASGGFIPLNDSGTYAGGSATARGSFAGWTISTANYSSVAGGQPSALLSFNNGQLVSNYLYRNAVPGQPQLNQMGTAIDMVGNDLNNAGTVNGTSLNVTQTAASGKVQLNDTFVENSACGAINGLVAKNALGELLSCQSGLWKKAVKSPNLYRYMFTSSQAWTVPNGVSAAFVTIAGGGGSGVGWRVSNATFAGHSGGFLFSQPVNLVEGETLQVTVGQGGQSFMPYSTGTPAAPGHPYYVHAAPGADDGLGGYPGTASSLVSPSMGTLVECYGGSGVHVGGIDTYSGSLVAGNVPGATVGSGSPLWASPNRFAAGPYATANSPGACGAALYGVGTPGSSSYTVSSGHRTGGLTPFGYGSGGGIFVNGCYVTTTIIGNCISPSPGRDGVVFIDVLY